MQSQIAQCTEVGGPDYEMRELQENDREHTVPCNVPHYVGDML